LSTELLRFKATGGIKQVMGIYKDDVIFDGEKWLFIHRRFELRYSMDLGSEKDATKTKDPG
jgi:hypothetical protein